MDDLRAYIISGDTSLVPAAKQLERLVERYPWFATARMLRNWQRGQNDPVGIISLTGKPMPKVYMREVASPAANPTLDIINNFLAGEDAGATKDAGTARSKTSEAPHDLPVVAEEGDITDIVSEELAEIYLAQGLTKHAVEVYRTLSLQNPKKSVYFAELIKQANKGNSKKQ